ncbi:nucleotidyltransferase family protein [Deinococcus yavapaiensis]|uniref:Putative nucleotidyltransferase-like protein n=1 Tax=Deinococcus yavapaiensis KR-236 TaxID=694435 RepID=A0A318SGE4_9DEIO|nr:nucleotidyltransferase family protein [Deinococcus yavapaiensis]PYE53131.1 putative nucleotidyltransferase-like protein [Deinococcus yavapaiensis KR-236]
MTLEGDFHPEPDTTADRVFDPAARDFYVRTLQELRRAEVPFLLGGAYALARYTGIERHTKDLDVFVRPEDARRTLDALARAGYETDLTFPHWLGKAHRGREFIDVIFSGSNGVGRVDDAWFEHAVHDEVFGESVSLCPAEEMIWHKAYVQERERFDGADVAHLLRARADRLDWDRLVSRFGPHRRVLLAHLVLFGFIYPGERHRVPEALLARLLDEVRAEAVERIESDECGGPILSRAQYLSDLEDGALRDARVTGGYMTPSDVAQWTAAIDRED